MKPSKTELTTEDLSRWPALQELRLNGPLFALPALCPLQTCIDWERLQRLKVSPFSDYQHFLLAYQSQLSTLKALAIGANGSERAPIPNWCGDMGSWHEHYAPPLYYSSLLNLEELTVLLLERGANANAHGGRFEYPLQAAAYSGNLRTVLLLLAYGADVNAKSRIFGNALQAATSRRVRPVIDVLITRGAKFANPNVIFNNVIQIALHLFDTELITHFILEGSPIQVPKHGVPSMSRSRPSNHIEQEGRDAEPDEDEITADIDDNASGSVVSLADVFEADEKSSWVGWYASNRDLVRHRTSFDIVTTTHQLACDEALFQGSWQDSVGQFSIQGRMKPAGHRAFVKLYQSFGWIYSGRLRADGKTLAGRWGALNSDSGTFQLSKTVPS